MHAATRGGPDLDVLIVSLGSTPGLRAADEALLGSLRAAGASAELVRARAPRPTRTLMLTDLGWARAARVAARAALGAQGDAPRAVIYSSTTAALLWPRPGAIRFDAPAAGNRPARHGLWQRPLERARLRQASLLLPWSPGALAEAPGAAGASDRAVVLPVAVAPSGPPAAARDIDVLTYAANPHKKGLDRVLAAWRRVRAEGATGAQGELVIAGVGAEELAPSGLVRAGEEGVRVAGDLPADDYRALLRRARVFACAPRREDYGIAQLEALADGCRLVSTPAPGPYAALPIASALDPRLVSDDLAGALATALSEPAGDYAERARAALVPFTPQAVQRVLVDQVLARLLG